MAALNDMQPRVFAGAGFYFASEDHGSGRRTADHRSVGALERDDFDVSDSTRRRTRRKHRRDSARSRRKPSVP